MDEELIITRCPQCKADEEHAVLKGGVQTITVRCMDCGEIRKMSPPKMRTTKVNAVISDGDQSRNTAIETPEGEEIRVGYEFELDDHRMIVTGIEQIGQKQVPRSQAAEIVTLFAKVFDTVPLKLSVNEGEKTRSYKIEVDPDMEVPVGLVLEAEGRKLVIKTLKSDQNRTLHKGFLYARNVRRAFCDVGKPWAKPGKVMQARPRGLGFGQKSTGPSRRIKGPRGQRGPKRS